MSCAVMFQSGLSSENFSKADNQFFYNINARTLPPTPPVDTKAIEHRTGNLVEGQNTQIRIDITSPSTTPFSNAEENINKTPSKQEVKYVSANCMVVTHYEGETAAVVDEHFSKALAAKPLRKCPQSSEEKSKKFPKSFYDPELRRKGPSPFCGTSTPSFTPSEIFDPYHGTFSPPQNGVPDPWISSFYTSSQTYGHRTVGYDMYPHSMPTCHGSYQYPSFGFQQHSFHRVPSIQTPQQMGKPESWGNRYYDSLSGASELTNGAEYANSPSYQSTSHYHCPSGVESGMMHHFPKISTGYEALAL